MPFFRYSPKHSTNEPPIGVVRGTLFGDPGQYKLQFRLVNSTEIFAGPSDIVIEEGKKSQPTNTPISRCQGANPPAGLRSTRIISQYKKNANLQFKEGAPRDINYQCSAR